ncbi:TrmJ/YjtD family RNA methyltransferase [Candidatus Woesearchaeota archaeon]|nr:TrmJ/YjtD family RNA methyltransferase [Candidatus Woesearchaeota archaeon]
MEIILIEPRKQENLGAVARAMKNFDFENLILINPKCKIGVKARKVAKHANDILDRAKIKKSGYLKNYDYLVGTTAILGTDYNIPRNAISIEQLGNKLSKIIKRKNAVNKKTKSNKDLRIGLLIGRETIGLKNEEIDLCDILATIPSSKKYPTLNISHSAAIMLYELFREISAEKSNSRINFAAKKDKEIIQEYINKILDKLEFSAKEKKETQKKVWKRVIGKAMLTKREAFSVMGFLRKLIK